MSYHNHDEEIIKKLQDLTKSDNAKKAIDSLFQTKGQKPKILLRYLKGRNGEFEIITDSGEQIATATSEIFAEQICFCWNQYYLFQD